jgi:O-antigen/teichoic acid export membrane protein
MLRKFGPVTADQILSSVSNMLVTVVVARSLSLEDLGWFALAYAVYSFGLGLARAYVHEPLLLNFGQNEHPVRAEYLNRAYCATFLVGIATGLVSLAIAFVANSSLREAMLPIALLSPLLLLQDTVRYADFAQHRASVAITSDAIWLGGFLLLAQFTDSLAGITTAWAAAGALSGALLRPWQIQRCLRTWPRLTWFKDHRISGGFFVMEFVLSQAVQQATIWFNAALAGPASVGMYRAGQLLIAPLRTLAGAAVIALLPRMANQAVDEIVRSARRYCLLNTATALACLICISVVPDGWGRLLLGDAWEGGQRVGQILCLGMIVAAYTQAQMLIIKATQLFSRSIRIRIVEAPLLVLGILVGTVLDDASGAALAFVVVAAVAAPWWRYVARSALREHAAVLTT